MTEEKIARINALAKKAKTEGLDRGRAGRTAGAAAGIHRKLSQKFKIATGQYGGFEPRRHRIPSETEEGQSMMELPRGVQKALTALEQAGYPAYVVGGAVRDHLRGVTPHDFDLCTAATPEETRQVFAQERVAETGLKHGTVTVLLDGAPLEITSFRVEGRYSDGRHPDQVRFVRDLESDLARRDFTVNAIAFSPTRGLQDPFGGQADIQARRLRAVGDPEHRFSEDALRILRGLRLMAETGFAH